VRNIRDQSFRRRQFGLTMLERHEEYELWVCILSFLTIIAVMPDGLVKQQVLAFAIVLMTLANSMRVRIHTALDPINDANCERQLNSWSEEECYK
jgi:hypothetical protein